MSVNAGQVWANSRSSHDPKVPSTGFLLQFCTAVGWSTGQSRARGLGRDNMRMHGHGTACGWQPRAHVQSIRAHQRTQQSARCLGPGDSDTRRGTSTMAPNRSTRRQLKPLLSQGRQTWTGHCRYRERRRHLLWCDWRGQHVYNTPTALSTCRQSGNPAQNDPGRYDDTPK